MRETFILVPAPAGLSDSRRRALERFDGDHGVEVARSEAFEIERHILEPELAEDLDHGRSNGRLDQLRKRLERDLDTRHVSLVIAHPEDPQPLAAKPTLGLVHHLDPLGTDQLAIRDPARETGSRRLGVADPPGALSQ